MLVDEVKVHFRAGFGGRGVVEFNRVKMHLGPVGGSGGKGASIYLEGVSDINALALFMSRKKIKADNGKDGRGQLTDGRDGEDLILKVPTGTRIVNQDTGEVSEITKVGERLLIAKGGRGGRGNYLLRSSRNTTPKNSEEGRGGEEVTLRLELRLIADVGLIGLPNAGKSSLLNELTSAHSKVGNYPFTTLEPSLGSYYELIIADIPGLISGASGGKGLGVKFLKHIERTKTLIHLVSVQSEDVVRDYKIVRDELAQFNPRLLEKKEYVLLSQSDTVEPDELKKKLEDLRAVNSGALPVSVINDSSLNEVRKLLNKVKEEGEIVDV